MTGDSEDLLGQFLNQLEGWLFKQQEMFIHFGIVSHCVSKWPTFRLRGKSLRFSSLPQLNQVKIKIYSKKFVENLSHDKSIVGYY